MTEERKDGATRRTDDVRDGEPALEYHPAPSMFWFIIPLLALLAYSYFSR